MRHDGHATSPGRGRGRRPGRRCAASHARVSATSRRSATSR